MSVIELKWDEPEMRDLIKDPVGVPRKLLETICLDAQQTFRRHLSFSLESEMTSMLGQDRYGRSEEDVSYRNGHSKHKHKRLDYERRRYIQFHTSFPERSSTRLRCRASRFRY